MSTVKRLLPLLLLLLFPVHVRAAYEMIDIVPMLTEQHEEHLVRSVITEAEEIQLAQMLWGEDRNTNDRMKQAAVIWCAFNRADAWEQQISFVVRESQFTGYNEDNPHPQWSHEIVRDVACRYALEQLGFTESGRVLPREYLYFAAGNDRHNRFRKEFEGKGVYWEWICWNPY